MEQADLVNIESIIISFLVYDLIYRKQKYEYRQSKKDEFQESTQYDGKQEDRPKKTHVDNPAAALVTQVPQGATKPVVNPT